MQGKTREEIVEESKPDAERDLRREAAMTAVAEAEEIEVSEEEMVEALAHSAEHERTTPEKLLERLRREGRDPLIREDLRTRKAIDLVVESAKPIPMAKAEAREKLWTPDDEREQAGSLWTPGITEGTCCQRRVENDEMGDAFHPSARDLGLQPSGGGRMNDVLRNYT